MLLITQINPSAFRGTSVFTAQETFMDAAPQPAKHPAKKRKRTARIICRNRTEYWTTQAQFWQWVREMKVVKLHHSPLTGKFVRESEETMVLLGNAVLNLAQPNHLNEVLNSRRYMKRR